MGGGAKPIQSLSGNPLPLPRITGGEGWGEGDIAWKTRDYFGNQEGKDPSPQPLAPCNHGARGFSGQTLNMLPTPSPENILNGAYRHPEELSESLGALATRTDRPSADFADHLLIQNNLRVPTASNAIQIVVPVITEVKMLGVAARRVVAVVENKSGFGEFRHAVIVNDSMDSMNRAADL